MTEADVVLALLDDTTPEVELIELVLETATGAVLGASSSIGLALVDDDSPVGVNQDFNLCGPGLPPGWEFVDPQGVGALGFRGAGTSDAGVVLTIPSGTFLPAGSDLPPRLRSAFEPTNFSIEVDFSTLITDPTQMQGVLFEEAGSGSEWTSARAAER